MCVYVCVWCVYVCVLHICFICIRPQFRLLEKKKIVRTEMDMARFDWLLFTYKYWRVIQIWL